ncbi:hypothetical protein K457DRAFT_28823 [Linnemannia elongata AG-77]|uniref:MULE transposase domain-containing protein n=1 Tax=Linnemannia elongata AG-77 TaxID=1314771 RepID=A0A197KA85_9FUNG|nr:hypothetical protein K457DRAFT_28823 [Linnemannia elongata AG-77]
MAGLRLKDIFLSPDAFDPLKPVEPYHIPPGLTTWTQTFTGEEFRSFWHNERIAIHWEHRSESTNRHLTPAKLSYDELLPIHNATELGAIGKPRKYDWSFRFCCRRHRKPQELAIDRDSVGTECPASIRMKKIVLENKLEDERTRGPMPPCIYMTQGDVRTAAYRIKTHDSRLALDPTLSVKLWLERIQQEDGKTMFIDQIPEFEHLFILRDNKGIDRQTHSGIPIAFMVCNSESIFLLRKWLTWLKTDCGLQATKFMVDCSITETETLKIVFPSLDIYYCLFHVGQAWERKLRELHGADEIKDVRKALKAIRHASSEDDLVQKWALFQQSFSTYTALIGYINNQWMKPAKTINISTQTTWWRVGTKL